MLAALKFLLVAALLLLLAWWIGGLPGDVTAHSGAYTVEMSVPAAVLLVAVLVLLLTVLLRVLGGIRRGPAGLSAWHGGRRARLGETATQRGLVALAAGDAEAARAEAGRARKLLGETPLVLLLAAEAARLGGRAAEAEAAFRKLATHKEMAFLGHRGLLRHSFAAGDEQAAALHAVAAERAYPGSAWLKDQRLQMAIRDRNWVAALALAKTKPQIAAFATAAAAASTETRQRLNYARQAVKADPGLAPAVVALAEALRAAGKPRAAAKILATGWKTAPNPLISEAYLAPFPAAIARAQAATELAAANPGHAESELLLGETALAAQLTGEARRHAEAAVAAGDNTGRAQRILATLDGTPLPPVRSFAWICDACHASHAAWAPVCPACQAPGSLAWRLPGTALA